MKDAPSPSLPKIGGQVISLSIFEILTQNLLSGELKPGDRLPTEIELSRKMGVGRNSVREAIKMLSSVGIVETRRGSGTYITESISSQMLNPLIVSLIFEQSTSEELVQLRLSLDTVAAQLALPNIQDSDLTRLAAINGKLMEAVKLAADDYQKIVDLDVCFHEEIYQLTHNRLLVKIGKAIYALFHASISKSVRSYPEKAFENHELIIHALKAKDIGLIQRRIDESLAFWKKHLDR